MSTPPIVPLAVTRAASAVENPHFLQIGGEQVIEQLVDRFYHHMDCLPEATSIRALHPTELGQTKRIFVRYLTEWMGGPAQYSAERGHPRLRGRHQGFPIGVAERDAWMLCMERALGEVVADESLRSALAQTFFKLADFLRNQPEAHE